MVGSSILGGISRELKRLGAIGHSSSILEGFARLLEGRLGSKSCKALRLLFRWEGWERQEVQVANSFPAAFVGKQDSRRFWQQPEKYFESIVAKGSVNLSIDSELDGSGLELMACIRGRILLDTPSLRLPDPVRASLRDASPRCRYIYI